MEEIYYFEDWVSYMLTSYPYSGHQLLDYEEYYENLLPYEENLENFLLWQIMD